MALDFSKLDALTRKGNDAPKEAGGNNLTPMPTKYKGYLFRSELEARWAKFFDICGVRWEYEADWFELKDGLRYRPDFRLHDVYLLDGRHFQTMYAEVKGEFRPETQDKEKVWRLAFGAYEWRHDWEVEPMQGVIVLGNIPYGKDLVALVEDAQKTSRECGSDPYEAERPVAMFNSITVLGKYYSMTPMIDKKGRLVLVAGHDTETIDGERTLDAYWRVRAELFGYKWGDKIYETAKQLEYGYEPTQREKLARATKNHLPGWLILEAAKHFVPTDFTPASSQARVDEGWIAVRLLKDGLRGLEGHLTYNEIFKRGYVNRVQWSCIHRMMAFFDLFVESRNSPINSTVRDYNECLKAFEQLIFGGFESRPKRQEFWDKWLTQQVESERWKAETQVDSTSAAQTAANTEQSNQSNEKSGVVSRRAK